PRAMARLCALRGGACHYAGVRQAHVVRMRGVEPPRLAALEPKSSASTSSATSASPPLSVLEEGASSHVWGLQGSAGSGAGACRSSELHWGRRTLMANELV